METNDLPNVSMESIWKMDKEAWVALSDEYKEFYIGRFIQFFLSDKEIPYTVAVDTIANILLHLYVSGRLSPDEVDVHLQQIESTYRNIHEKNKSKE